MILGKSASELSLTSRFTGSYALSTAAMAIFEAKNHDRKDPIAINNYGEFSLLTARKIRVAD